MSVKSEESRLQLSAEGKKDKGETTNSPFLFSILLYCNMKYQLPNQYVLVLLNSEEKDEILAALPLQPTYGDTVDISDRVIQALSNFHGGSDMKFMDGDEIVNKIITASDLDEEIDFVVSYVDDGEEMDVSATVKLVQQY